MVTDEGRGTDRRGFLASIAMWGGLAAGYGLGLVHFIRYLVPMGEGIKYREMFVGPVDELDVGKSRTVRTPSGDTFVMARTAEAATADSFRILSDVCPHLGCRVHWQADHNRFFCPCHAGAFDAEGTATEGPPAEAGQNLTRLTAVVRGNSVFVLIREA